MVSNNPKKIVSPTTQRVSWRARFCYTSPVDGTRKFRSKNCRTQKQALAWIAEQRAQHHAGTYFEPSKMTVGEYAERWFVRRKASLRGSSWNLYRSIWERDLEQRFAHRPLAQVRRAEIQDFIDTLPHKPRTVDQSYSLLHQILKAAVADDLLRFNPATGCSSPKPPRETARHWSEIDVHRFFGATVDHPSHPLWRLLVTSGLRIGEALALTWDDIDTDRLIVRVNKTIRIDVDGKHIIGAGGKTTSSNRLVHVPRSTIAALARQRHTNNNLRVAAGDRWTEHNLVFPSPVNGSFRAHPSVALLLKRLSERAGVPYVSPHGLRHTYATLAARQGIHMLSVKEQLGHTSIAMTMDLYSHADAGMLEKVAAAMEHMFPVPSVSDIEPERQKNLG